MQDEPAASGSSSEKTQPHIRESPRPKSADTGLVAFLRPYLVGDRYWQTVTDGLFHMVAIMVAFIIGIAWGSREAELRDIRAQQGVLMLLTEEIDGLLAHAQDLSAFPHTPCSAGFEGNTWKTPIWDEVSKSDKFLLIDERFYPKVRQIYYTVATAGTHSMNLSPPTCRKFLAALAGDLKTFEVGKDGIKARVEMLKARYKGGFSRSLWQIILLAIAGLLTICSLPLGLRAVEFALRRRSAAAGGSAGGSAAGFGASPAEGAGGQASRDGAGASPEPGSEPTGEMPGTTLR